MLEQLSDQTMQNQSLIASKRKLESEMQTLHVSTVLNIPGLCKLRGYCNLSYSSYFGVFLDYFL